MSQLKDKASKIDHMKDLFKYKTCRLSKQSMRLIAGFSMHNRGGSDQAFSLTLAVAWKVLFLEIDIEINNEQLANGTPCQTTLSNAEYRCASECFLMVVGKLKHCKYYALSQDAGHRAGLEHLIKMISYPWVDKNGNRLIRNSCLDIDTCIKTTLEVAAGINKSLRRLERLTPAKYIGVTDDSAGGGVIQNIIKPLVANNTLLPWAKHIRCFCTL